MFKCSAKPGQAIQVICPILGHTEKREFSLKKKKKGKRTKNTMIYMEKLNSQKCNNTKLKLQNCNFFFFLMFSYQEAVKVV